MYYYYILPRPRSWGTSFSRQANWPSFAPSRGWSRVRAAVCLGRLSHPTGAFPPALIAFVNIRFSGNYGSILVVRK